MREPAGGAPRSSPEGRKNPHQARKTALSGDTAPRLLATCVCLFGLWGQKEKDLLLVGGGGGYLGKEKNLFCLGLSQFLQMQ